MSLISIFCKNKGCCDYNFSLFSKTAFQEIDVIILEANGLLKKVCKMMKDVYDFATNVR